MNARSVAAVLGGVFGVLALCGSWAAYAAPPADACSLLTPAQVTAALGVSVTAGESIVPGGPAMCGWEVAGQHSMDRKRAVLSVYTRIGSQTPLERFKDAKTPMAGIEKEPVNGVGDDAIFATTPGFGTGSFSG